MEILPPTDSLHKFLAIGGLILLFGPLFYFFKISKSLESDYVNISVQIEILEIDVDYFTRIHDIKSLNEKDYSSVIEYKKRLAELRGKNAEMAFKQSELALINSFRNIILVLGTIMTSFGFAMWGCIEIPAFFKKNICFKKQNIK